MICVYEDEGFAGLSPMVDLRPTFDLRCGRSTLLEKLRRLYPGEEFNLWVRDELATLTAEAHPDCRVNKPVRKGRLFFSGRAVLAEPIPPWGREKALVCGEEVVGFRLCADCAVKLSTARMRAGFSFSAAALERLRSDLGTEPVKATVVKWPWDIVELNPGELSTDTAYVSSLSAQRSTLRGVVVVGDRRKLAVRQGARVWPGVVLNTEAGPIEVDRGAAVRPGSIVEGPCYIGPDTVIDGARVRSGCSFGRECRVGGEVEASVFQGYANKRHDGYIGHSYVGEWVNLGAMTSNSDLKNNYEPVRATAGGKPIDTGRLKVGCFIGDHVKTAIGSLLSTGAVVGTFANWFTPGLSPKAIAAFAWGKGARWRLREALATARAVMARRGVSMSPAYEQLLRLVHRRAAG